MVVPSIATSRPRKSPVAPSEAVNCSCKGVAVGAYAEAVLRLKKIDTIEKIPKEKSRLIFMFISVSLGSRFMPIQVKNANRVTAHVTNVLKTISIDTEMTNFQFFS